MRIVEGLDSPERDASRAGSYLQRHADDKTVQRIAALLRSRSSKLVLRALRYLSEMGARAQWPTQVEDLKACVQRWPLAADLLAALESEAAFDALMELATDPKVDAASVGEALRTFDDGKRALALGFHIIDCDDSCPYPQRDALIAGLFDEADDGATRSRLLAVVSDPLATMEKRRRAFIAYQATHVNDHDPNFQLLEDAFALSSGELRAAMVRAYPDRLSDADELRRAVARSPEEGLRLIERAGPAAVTLAPTVEPFLHSDNINLRLIASEVMHAVARDGWRARIEALAADTSPLIAYETLQFAQQDSKASLEHAERGARRHWFPGIAAGGTPPWDKRRDVASASIGKCHAGRDDELLISNDAHHAEVFPNACASAAAPAALLGLASLMHDKARLERAQIEADTLLSWRLTSALEVPGGWLLGADQGEWGGALSYVSSIHESGPSRAQQVARSGAEPLVIFRWRDAVYAVVGGPNIDQGNRPPVGLEDGSWPELDMLEEQQGPFVAKPIAHLPAPVIGVYGDDARLLMLTEHAGIIDLSDPERPRWLGCMR